MRQLLGVAFSLFLISCTHQINPNQTEKQQKQLYKMLMQSSNQLDKAEAVKLSKQAIQHSTKLASKYRVTTPPLIHNFLVNIRAKERGLCYQWSDDLYKHLKRNRFRTIQIKPVGANIGSYWTEHNALVVLPKGIYDLKHGILLDPWRNSGQLYFIPILQDREYRWSIRNDRGEIYQSGI